MSARFVMFMALLTSGSAIPHHSPDIQVNIEQKVKTGCGNGGCVSRHWPIWPIGYYCVKSNGYCLKTGDRCKGTIELLANWYGDHCCCCLRPLPGPENSLCQKMNGNCQQKYDDCQCLGMRINHEELNTKYCESQDYSCCAPSGRVFVADIENALSYALRKEILFYWTKTGIRKDRTYRKLDCDALRTFFRILYIRIKDIEHIQTHTYNFIGKFSAILDSVTTDFDVNWVITQLDKIQNGETPKTTSFISADWHPSVSCHYINPPLSFQHLPDCFLRYTCGLWNIFHTLTVSAYYADRPPSIVSVDPLEVPSAIYDYVINFLGCSDCEGDFRAMYEQTISMVTTKVTTTKKAILWLWCVHNKVNLRHTDQNMGTWPPHPQFPLKGECPDCWADKGNPWSCPDCKYTNCQKLFCYGTADCFRTTGDPDPIIYHSFSESVILSYLKSIYRGPYSYLNTNDKWKKLNIIHSNNPC